MMLSHLCLITHFLAYSVRLLTAAISQTQYSQYTMTTALLRCLLLSSVLVRFIGVIIGTISFVKELKASLCSKGATAAPANDDISQAAASHSG